MVSSTKRTLNAIVFPALLLLPACRAQTEEPAPPARAASVEPLASAQPSQELPAQGASVEPLASARPTPEPAPALLAPEAYAASSTKPSEPSPSATSLPKALEASADGRPASGKKRRYVVAAIGDSLTDTRVGGGRYLAFLSQRCPESRFDSYGKGGEMVNQMRRRFAADIFGEGDPTKPKYTDVIVFGGVNDLYSDLTAGRTVPKITSDLTAMYGAARARGLRVVAVTVAPWGGFHKYFTDARAATTSELNAWILAQKTAGAVDAAVDSYPLLACGRELCPEVAAPFHDGLHFGPEGHRRLAEALFRDAFSDCR